MVGGHADRTIEEMFYRGNCWWRDRTQTYFTCDFEQNTATYLVVNCSGTVMGRIMDGEVTKRPFALDALLADECLKAWQDAISHYRGRLIDCEYRDIDTDNKEALATKTVELHSLSSNLHRVTEHLADFEERMNFLRDALRTYRLAIEQNQPKWRMENMGRGADVDESLRFLIDGAKMGRRWAVDYLQRARLRINLMFHLCSQNDNKVSAALTSTSIEITRLTSAISEEAQRDNSAMITLSIMAMLFLPGTFVAGIFSMAFFNYTSSTVGGNRESYTVSGMLWLYFAITVPLTLGVFVVWDGWRRWRLKAKGRGKKRGGGGLAILYANQGKSKSVEAEFMFRRALVVSEKILARNPVDTAIDTRTPYFFDEYRKRTNNKKDPMEVHSRPKLGIHSRNAVTIHIHFPLSLHWSKVWRIFQEGSIVPQGPS
ncbi:hypothetical protein FGG08_005062 [Glutinoglossum americanum]|uniref:Uncharacterized protein n=1 Tax=Glutinoglossum americanum TaxID=1670608 RepID=A0A9P8I3R6_9PEZI|nr:hypothetical protein FGG08_005062 [Glutinoglossum americanum]